MEVSDPSTDPAQCCLAAEIYQGLMALRLQGRYLFAVKFSDTSGSEMRGTGIQVRSRLTLKSTENSYRERYQRPNVQPELKVCLRLKHYRGTGTAALL